ncbi:hypothetical protein HPB47_026884 [Ixodes persulcatus]|uniref:Uncharacterized protein n=1 Tax=Ixodes persulcatus TaxID=34615 RepID=A0AC60PXE8_IXOPE|nr:hypothetical protein HPB47_026884 [Ixodes persulcatus]
MGLPKLSISTMRRLLKDIGFAFRKRKRYSALLEREDIIMWRRKYLRTIQEMRKQKRASLSLQAARLRRVDYTVDLDNISKKLIRRLGAVQKRPPLGPGLPALRAFLTPTTRHTDCAR